MSKAPTEQETIKMITCLPFALDPTLPKDAEDQIRSVFTAYIDLMKNHQAMKEALENLIKHNERLNSAFYVAGTAKATRAAMSGQKELLVAARQALTLASGKDKEP